MSYGRFPYYIYSDGAYFNFFGDEREGQTARVSYDQMAQFIASLAARGDEEINELIERGKQLRPDDISQDLHVSVSGGFLYPRDQTVADIIRQAEQAIQEAMAEARGDPPPSEDLPTEE